MILTVRQSLLLITLLVCVEGRDVVKEVAEQDSCLTGQRVSACVDGLPEWEVVSDGFWPDMDCETREILGNIAILGRAGVEEWYQICATMEPSQQGGKRFEPQPIGWQQGFECTFSNGPTLFALHAKERDVLVGKGAVNCVEKENPIWDGPDCGEEIVDFCIDAGFDYAIFDPSQRPDCCSKSMRDELAFLGMEGLEDYETECATRSESLS